MKMIKKMILLVWLLWSGIFVFMAILMATIASPDAMIAMREFAEVFVIPYLLVSAGALWTFCDILNGFHQQRIA